MAHRGLAERFPRGELVLVDGASHLLPIDRPDVVIATVRDVLFGDSLTGDERDMIRCALREWISTANNVPLPVTAMGFTGDIASTSCRAAR